MRLSQLIRRLNLIKLESGGEDKEIVVHSPEGFVDILSVWTDETAPAIVMEVTWLDDDPAETNFKETLQEI